MRVRVRADTTGCTTAVGGVCRTAEAMATHIPEVVGMAVPGVTEDIVEVAGMVVTVGVVTILPVTPHIRRTTLHKGIV